MRRPLLWCLWCLLMTCDHPLFFDARDLAQDVFEQTRHHSKADMAALEEQVFKAWTYKNNHTEGSHWIERGLTLTFTKGYEYAIETVASVEDKSTVVVVLELLRLFDEDERKKLGIDSDYEVGNFTPLFIIYSGQGLSGGGIVLGNHAPPENYG